MALWRKPLIVPALFAGVSRSHRPGRLKRPVRSSSPDKSQEHDPRLARSETVRCSGLHAQPRAGYGVELLSVRGELETAFDNLHDRRPGCLMLAESFSCIEARDCDLGSASRKITRDTTRPQPCRAGDSAPGTPLEALSTPSPAIVNPDIARHRWGIFGPAREPSQPRHR